MFLIFDSFLEKSQQLLWNTRYQNQTNPLLLWNGIGIDDGIGNGIDIDIGSDIGIGNGIDIGIDIETLASTAV